MSDKDDRNYMITAAAWQEGLLQSYRRLHVTIQSILLTIGVGLTIAAVSLDKPVFLASEDSTRQGGTLETLFAFFVPSLVCSIVFIVIMAFSFYSHRKFSWVVLCRGDDINWWQQKIIEHEQQKRDGKAVYPREERYFTHFKLHQKMRRIAENGDTLFEDDDVEFNEDKVHTLVGKGLGHTRKVIDKQLFLWLKVLWIGLLIINVLSVSSTFFPHSG